MTRRQTSMIALLGLLAAVSCAAVGLASGALESEKPGGADAWQGVRALVPDAGAWTVMRLTRAPESWVAGTAEIQPIASLGGGGWDGLVRPVGLERTEYPIGTLLWSYLITGHYDNSPKAIAPISDVNDDGIDDVIVCSEDYYIRCFSGASSGTGDVVWSHEIYAGSVYSQPGLTISEDLDGDGYEDVVVASAWGGRLIRAISGHSGREIWTHDTHEYGNGGWVYQVDSAYDYNDDGIDDVLASAGDDGSDTGPQRVYCLNGLDGVSIWERYLGAPGYAVIGIEDFTGDGQPDALAGTSNAFETEGRAYGIDGADGTIEWTFIAGGSSVWGLAQIDDITGDGIKDVMVGDFSGNYYGLDATDGSQEYSGSGFGLIVRLQELEDVSGDGHPDVVPGHAQAHVTVINGQTGGQVWSHPVADKAWNVAASEDISGDDVGEVYAGTLFSNNYCYFLSGADGSELHSINLGTAVDAIGAIPDVVGDDSMEMVAGGRDGTVACFSGGLGVSCAGQERGDTNGDGSINGLDIDPFVDALVDPEQYDIDYAPLRWECVADINCDGSMNGLDIDPFVQCLTGGCPDCP